MSDYELTDEISLFCKMKMWTLVECARIVAGLPVNTKIDRSDPDHARAFYIQVLLERAHDPDIKYFRPTILLNQLKTLNINVDENLMNECEKYENIYYSSDIFQSIKKLKSENKSLSRKVKNLEFLTEEVPAKSRNNLYRLIHAAIRMKYNNATPDDPTMTNDLFRLVEQYEGAPQTLSLQNAINEVFKYVSRLERTTKASR